MMFNPGDKVRFRSGERGGCKEVFNFRPNHIFTIMNVSYGSGGTPLATVYEEFCVYAQRFELVHKTSDYDPKQQPYDEDDI